MIKVDVLTKEDGTVSLYFESLKVDQDSLDKLDSVYQALIGNYPKVGGYTFSNKFKIEVLIGKTE